MSRDQYQLFTGFDYFALLPQLIHSAAPDAPISVVTMSLEPSEPAVQDVLRALQEAGRRGSEVRLVVDDFTLSDPMSVCGLKVPFVVDIRRSSRRHAALKQLRDSPGIDVSIVNRLPQVGCLFKGRSHLKYVAIGDDCFIGGPSLHCADRIDLVLRISDLRLATHLHAIARKLQATGWTLEALGILDYELRVDQDTILLVDVGVPKQSGIYRQAIETIDEAQAWILLASQYFPGKALTKRLLAAHERGVEIAVHYNGARKHDRLVPLQTLRDAVQRLRYPQVIFDHELPEHLSTLHAKVLLTEKRAIIGNHNFVSTGVQYGTAEMSVQTRNPLVIEQARVSLEVQLGG